MVAYLVIIWFMDRYEREPVWLVFLNFFWGATGAIFFAIIGSLVMNIGISQFIYEFANESDYGTLNNLAGAVIIAPLVEEMTKGAFLFITALSRHYDGPVDGAVYGGAVGLGFGMTENFLYFISYGRTIESLVILIIIRTLFSAVLHCCTQATFGAAIGYAKFKGTWAKLLIVPIGLMIAIFMHFMWNLTVSFNSTALIGFAFMIMTIIVIFIVFQFGVYHEGKIILRELTEEANNGYLPREHLKYLPYTSKRYKKGWLPHTIDQKTYVKSATTLALRKNQSKGLKSSTKTAYHKEIEFLRSKIYYMLYPPPKTG
jgi:RsiW-degrading membrane proteinase PrsW (M82 family)